jgi:hypothetical protein
MQRMSSEELQALIASTPDIPENADLLNYLDGLARAAQVLKFPYTATAAFFTAGANNNIAAGASTPATPVSIDALAPMLITGQSYDANTANAARSDSSRVIPNAVVAIQDSGGRQWSDVPVRVPAWFGTGEFPYVLPEPKWLQANSAISIVVTNQDAAAGINLWLHFHGYRLFKLG